MKTLLMFIISIAYLSLLLLIYVKGSPTLILLTCILVIILTGILGTVYLVKKKARN